MGLFLVKPTSHETFLHTIPIAIKRYYEKDIFEQWISIGQGKVLSKHNARYVMFFKSYLD